MYCVLCGSLLQEKNQEGIICQSCKQEQKKKSREQTICVSYCFGCGKPYHPGDLSIRHLSCATGMTKLSMPDWFFQHVFSRARVEETRKEMYVLL